MSSHSSSKSVLAAAAFAAAVLAPLYSPVASAAPGKMVFCVDRANPSASMDTAVARAASAAVGYQARIDHFDTAKYGDNGAPRDLFLKLVRRCNLVMGFPSETGSSLVPQGLNETAGYLPTGFVLVERGKRPPAFKQLPAGTQVGVTYLTAPNTYFTHSADVTSQVYSTSLKTVDALVKGAVQAAIVWQPYLLSYEKRHPKANLHWRQLQMPHAHWQLVALYRADGKGDKEAALFERGVKKLDGNGELPRMIKSYKTLASVEPSPKVKVDPPAPGLFTAAQARAGAKVYAGHCAECHGGKLQGMVGPTLKGSGFAAKSMNYTVGGMFGFMSQQMPAGEPGSLSHKQYAEVMAFILKENGYPAGKKKLTYTGAKHSKVALVSKVK